MQKIALDRGGWCLSSEYINSKTKLWWQCEEGHIWDSNPNVIESGAWCPTCGYIKNAKNNSLKIIDMQNIALERGGWCLSPKYFDSKTKL